MGTSRWTDAVLNEASEQGDSPEARPNADDLAAQVLGQPDGVRRYNHLLAMADMLLASPALVLTEKSALRQHLREVAPETLAYYQPAPAPAWLDEHKLRIASRLWHDNAIASIGVLYALSLPCAYLYITGVPALYETGKLAKHEYIFQRIYETGLFADAVMDEGGIEVLEDDVPGKRSTGQRFLWGRGYLATKKVRFLHASIRYMLEHPPQVDKAAASADGSRTLTEYLTATHWPKWDRKKNKGAPINQEQLALVLLTFGYLIPMGLERWGCRVSREQKHAFLHLWRVVGHILGIRDDLMTDDWDEAEALTRTILARQAGPSDYGKHLTVSLMDFMRSYLPHLPGGLRQRLAAHFIVDQLEQLDPGYPAMVLPAEDLDAVRRPVPRFLYGALRSWIRIYYRMRGRIVGALPFVGHALLTALHHSSEELIASWRDQFRRKPFDLSKDMTWQRSPGFSLESAAPLERWRRRVFNNITIAVVCLFVAVALLLLLLLTLLVPHSLLADKLGLLKTFGLGAVVLAGAAWFWMTWRLPRIFASRPGAQDEEGA